MAVESRSVAFGRVLVCMYKRIFSISNCISFSKQIAAWEGSIYDIVEIERNHLLPYTRNIRKGVKYRNILVSKSAMGDGRDGVEMRGRAYSAYHAIPRRHLLTLALNIITSSLFVS